MGCPNEPLPSCTTPRWLQDPPCVLRQASRHRRANRQPRPRPTGRTRPAARHRADEGTPLRSRSDTADPPGRVVTFAPPDRRPLPLLPVVCFPAHRRGRRGDERDIHPTSGRQAFHATRFAPENRIEGVRAPPPGPARAGQSLHLVRRGPARRHPGRRQVLQERGPRSPRLVVASGRPSYSPWPSPGRRRTPPPAATPCGAGRPRGRRPLSRMIR